MKLLNFYVDLPEVESEQTLFMGSHQQKTPLQLRDTAFKTDLKNEITAMNEKIANERIKRP